MRIPTACSVLLLSIFSTALVSAPVSVIIEAESYVSDGGGVGALSKTQGRIESSGNTSIVAWNNKGHHVSWEADFPADGEYKAVLRYAHSRKWNTVRDLTIDGVYPSDAFRKIMLPATGGLCRDENNWNNLTVTGSNGKPAAIKIKAGKHTIKMTNLGGEFNDDGQSNFDAIGFIPLTSSTAALGKQCVMPKNDYVIKVNPKGIKYSEAVFEKLDIKRGIIYTSQKNEKGVSIDIKLDTFIPLKDASEKRPAVIVIHGGGFRSGTREEMDDLCIEYAKRGYVSLSVDYRTRAKPMENINDTVKDALSDTIDAMKWLLQNASALRVDPAKIFVCGESAGANLAILMAYENPVMVNPHIGSIAGVLYLYGTNPAVTLNSRVPLLIIHADKDSVVPYSNSVKLKETAATLNIPFDMYTMEGGNHTYNNKFYTEVISRTSAFMYKNVNGSK